jgi:ubiquitin-protein ligase E3 C
LSGQKISNPFAATSWAPGSSTGPSKTIADAQAERRQRQQERERKQAAHQIQRAWRGHTVRRTLGESLRGEFDDIYNVDAQMLPDDRLLRGLPLLLAIFKAHRADDRHRLDLVARDLLDTSFAVFSSGQIHETRLNKLSRILVTGLER